MQINNLTLAVLEISYKVPVRNKAHCSDLKMLYEEKNYFNLF